MSQSVTIKGLHKHIASLFCIFPVWSEYARISVLRMIFYESMYSAKYVQRIIQDSLQDFQRMSDHFGKLSVKRLTRFFPKPFFRQTNQITRSKIRKDFKWNCCNKLLKSIKKVRSGLMQFSVVDLLSFLLTLHRDLPLRADQWQKLCYRQKYISKVWDYETKKTLWQLPAPIEIDIWSSSEKFEKKWTSELPFSVKRLVWRSRNLLETSFF